MVATSLAKPTMAPDKALIRPSVKLHAMKEVLTNFCPRAHPSTIPGWCWDESPCGLLSGLGIWALLASRNASPVRDALRVWGVNGSLRPGHQRVDDAYHTWFIRGLLHQSLVKGRVWFTSRVAGLAQETRLGRRGCLADDHPLPRSPPSFRGGTSHSPRVRCPSHLGDGTRRTECARA